MFGFYLNLKSKPIRNSVSICYYTKYIEPNFKLRIPIIPVSDSGFFDRASRADCF